ncbi:MAG: AraC family transcriptional regulator ligand-binding domain-containing protein [Pseudomonadota bacterium]
MSETTHGAGIFSDMFSVLFAFGQSRGLSIEDMAVAANVDALDVVDPGKRLPDHSIQALWNLIADTDTDGSVPLKLATAAPLTVFAGLAEGARYASTLGAAIEHIARNEVVIADRLKITIDHTDKSATIRLSHPLDHLDQGRFSIVGIFLLQRLIREILEVPNALTQVRLQMPKPASASAIVAFFQCDVAFGCDISSLSISREVYGATINHANAELFAFVEMHFSKMRNSLQEAHWPTRLRTLRGAIIENALKSDYRPLSASSAANLSLRSAQRLARSEGHTLQEMIDEVRFENAKALLKSSDLSISRVAEVLAYSDDRSFRRAFKRVVGMSPTAYRKAKAQSGGRSHRRM